MKIIATAALAIVAVLASSTPFFAQQGSVTISDFPQHGTQLNPGQMQELRLFARAVVGALVVGTQMDIAIYGHADFDARGREFEATVSQRRAQGAHAAFINLLKEEAVRVGVPDSRLQSVNYRVIGLGTMRPVFPNPRNEADRKANRRVEFVWSATVVPAPITQSLFQRCISVLAGTTPPGPVRRMTCACTKFNQVPATQDTHYDFRASRQLIPGSAGMPNLSLEQWDAAIRGIVHHMKRDISVAAQGASDAEFRLGLMTLDDTVGRNINDFHSQLAGGVDVGLFDRVINADIQNRMNDQNHVYSCYAGYSRREHDR